MRSISRLVQPERIYSFLRYKLPLWLRSLHAFLCFVGGQIIHYVDTVVVFNLLMLKLSTSCHLKTWPGSTSDCDWVIYDGSNTALKFLATSMQSVIVLSSDGAFTPYRCSSDKLWCVYLFHFGWYECCEWMNLNMWQTYYDRQSHWLVCTQPAASQFPHHRWCRAGRGRGSFPGQSKYRPYTPHTPCRDRVRSAHTPPVLPGTPYTVHIGLTSYWRKSCSCRCRWHRWSRCRASSSASGRCTRCRACTALCDCSSPRRSHLQMRGQVEGDETEKWEGGNERRGKK